jgi:nitroreductase
MGSMNDAIRQRFSTRTYLDKPIEEDTRNLLLDAIRSERSGPFGHTTRFELVDLKESEGQETKAPGTYGVIKGTRLFIVAVTGRAEKSMEDLGYCLERIVLKATNLGLATCWMAGTFTRRAFARLVHAAEGEIVPAICPVGYGSPKRTARDSFFRFIAQSHRRKPWTDLFFDGTVGTPLNREKLSRYAIPLEAVRLAPSASNRQPWRIVRELGRDIYHFYLKRTKGYGQVIREFKIQNIDMGIAMCHFELAAIETGLAGQWQEMKPGCDGGGMEYVVTWIG